MSKAILIRSTDGNIFSHQYASVEEARAEMRKQFVESLYYVPGIEDIGETYSCDGGTLGGMYSWSYSDGHHKTWEVEELRITVEDIYRLYKNSLSSDSGSALHIFDETGEVELGYCNKSYPYEWIPDDVKMASVIGMRSGYSLTLLIKKTDTMRKYDVFEERRKRAASESL